MKSLSAGFYNAVINDLEDYPTFFGWDLNWKFLSKNMSVLFAV